jgi:hypothetical protein
MPSQVNRPTGLGYQSSLQRICAECGHTEIVHWEHSCFRRASEFSDEFCPCLGFTARERDENEKRALAEIKAEKRKKAEESRPEVLNDVWLEQLERDFRQRRIKGIDD